MRFRGSYQRAVRSPNVQELFLAPRVQLNGTSDPCSGDLTNATTGDDPTATFEQCANSGVTAEQFGFGSDLPARGDFDEDRYEVLGLANFTKALPHNDLGEVDLEPADRGVVARLHDHALHQLLDGHRREGRLVLEQRPVAGAELGVVAAEQLYADRSFEEGRYGR